MEKLLFNLEKEIELGMQRANNTKELYQLLSSYNAYNILLLKAQNEYEKTNSNIKQYYIDKECYRTQIEDLFSLFKNNECLKLKEICIGDHMDMLFLIDENTILRMYSFDKVYSLDDLSCIGYYLLNINDCKVKIYDKDVYCGDPYYSDYHFETKEAFGLFDNNRLITPNYALDIQFKIYDSKDIRKILKIQSLDEIYRKIKLAKEEKEKKLVLIK